ncbi:hypothetical protein JTB14_031707 [Gonioctena quinquepunctata]|nr:hypothetical protein JTB14_031707 [Gonioctena quinquepunctata]
MPLRRKEAEGGVLLDLLDLRIDSGDKQLKTHLEKCRRNAVYTSPQIQNELIGLCGEVIREDIMSDIKKTIGYAVLADETADIAGKEQLSIGLRFYDDSKGKIREEFVGFVELYLPPGYCVRFGFDGGSAMAGKDGDVQAILRNKYSRALYFHCSSHKLNLVVKKKVSEIRNTIATIKDTIHFSRESAVRRNCAPNLSRMCQTRWSEKYKLIRKCSQHFPELVKALEKLCTE